MRDCLVAIHIDLRKRESGERRFHPVNVQSRSFHSPLAKTNCRDTNIGEIDGWLDHGSVAHLDLVAQLTKNLESACVVI